MTAERATIGAGKRTPVPLDDAVASVLAAARTLEGEEVPLSDALGRVLAAAVVSPIAVPPFDNSAMDGYAVRAADTRGAPVTLRVIGESRAGAPASTALGPGCAIAISTGAGLPDGADAVVRLEDTVERERDGSVAVTVAVEPGRDVRRAGEDIAAGETVLGAGAELGPAELGAVASTGARSVLCSRRPTITILTTGDELAEPGAALGPGQIHNSNSYSVPAQARRAGCEVIAIGTVPDREEETVVAVRDALATDIAVVCGGVSVGRHDHVKTALAVNGVAERFWGVALRPGRPTWFGVLEGDGEGTLVFGLPGNPVSAMVTFELFVAPAIDAMTGRSERQRPRVHAAFDAPYPKPAGRAHVVRCRLEARDDGWHARPTKDQGSHVLTSMLDVDGLAVIPAEHADVEPGERFEVLLTRAVS